ncbi:MAG: hypothetical protein ACOY42_00850 [Pseudomonadota bacterium]|jgi:hypothetical protein
MTWHTFTLDRAARAARENELLMAFDLCFAAAAGPDDMALLAAEEPGAATRYYASPTLATWGANLLEQLGAEPCARPAPDRALRLLVGHQGCLEALLGA